jgi:uncharacterized protein YjbI with pentapeptide repeats
MAPLTSISVADLAKRIIDGERDFSDTRLSGDANLGALPSYADLLAYLRGQDLRNSPLIAERADWSGLSAPGVFFQATKLSGANLSRANLQGADLRRAELVEAQLVDADLSGATLVVARLMKANLQGASLRMADLYEANTAEADLRGANAAGARVIRLSLKDANLSGAFFTGTDLYRADLRGAIGLDQVRDLATARFHQTIVGDRERSIVLAAMRDGPLFEYRAE